MDDPYRLSRLPSPIRITTDSGEQHILYKASFEGEYLVGYAAPQYDSVKPERRSFPVSSVVDIEYGDPSAAQQAGQAAALGLGAAVLMVLVLAIIAAASWGGGYD